MFGRQQARIGGRVAPAFAMVGLLLTTAACGARWTDSQKETALRSLAGSAAAEGSEGAAAEGGEGAAADGGTGSSAVDGGSGTGTTGAVVGSGGTAGDGGAGVSEPSTRPCAAPSQAPGVTDGEIVLGTMQSLSGPVPGLGASNLAAIQAYVDHRNAEGGVCGRKLVVRKGDDGADNARGRQIVAELEPQILAFISGTSAGMDGGASVVDATRLPALGTAIAPNIERSPTYYGLNPPPAATNVVIGKYRFLFEHGARKAAVVYISAAAAPQQAKREMEFMRAAGIQVVNEQALPLTTLSYDSAARSVANSGADYLLFLHADGPSASMARSMADTGYKGLKFGEYIVAYGSNFPELAGSAAEGATTWLYALPAEDGGKVPEQAAFLTAMAQSAPDASVDTFAAQGWSSLKLLTDSLEALPGPITRDALLAQLAKTGDYDAGGLLGQVNVGRRITKNCVIGMVLRNGAWQRMAPASGFLC